MAKKKEKTLPVLTINNEEDDTARRYVSVLHVHNVLISLQLTAVKEPEKLNDQIMELQNELKLAFSD